jgi:hypothetical protein
MQESRQHQRAVHRANQLAHVPVSSSELPHELPGLSEEPEELEGLDDGALSGPILADEKLKALELDREVLDAPEALNPE